MLDRRGGDPHSPALRAAQTGGAGNKAHGAVAQLGERRVRNAKVRGSIPLGSTIPPRVRFDQYHLELIRNACFGPPAAVKILRIAAVPASPRDFLMKRHRRYAARPTAGSVARYNPTAGRMARGLRRSVLPCLE
jgi:hypothetical protein